MHIVNTLVLNTGHVPREVALQIMQGTLIGIKDIYRYEDGWVLPTDEIEAAVKGHCGDEVPECLVDAMRLAKDSGCTFIKWDKNEEPTDRLKTYQW